MARPTIDPENAEVTVIVVSYNTRELTVKALRTLLENGGDIRMRVIVWDNASEDGSADAIAEAFPAVELIRSQENIGFARANNLAAETITSDWIVLLNPDTETHSDAIRNLVDFAKSHPQAGIVGGRTVFPDGSLNIASCWNRMTVWSMVSSALGLSAVFKNSAFFNPEGLGSWQRDSVRQVDIIVGCFLAIRTSLWQELGGFNSRYTMYGEDCDLCLRAIRLGYAPMITPEAQIMHLVGAASAKRSDKLIKVYRGKATIIRDHWSKALVGMGLLLLWLQIASRRFGYAIKAYIAGADARAQLWREVWQSRALILRGYPDER